MEKEKAFLLWFDQLERKDVAIAGGKSSSLGELTSHVDVPVPWLRNYCLRLQILL